MATDVTVRPPRATVPGAAPAAVPAPKGRRARAVAPRGDSGFVSLFAMVAVMVAGIGYFAHSMATYV